jgi:hypothetical protein
VDGRTGRLDANNSRFSQCYELAYHDFSLFMLLCVLFCTAELKHNSTKHEIYGLNLPVFTVGVATHLVKIFSAVQIRVPKFLVCTIPLKEKKYSITPSPCFFAVCTSEVTEVFEIWQNLLTLVTNPRPQFLTSYS